MTTQIKAIETRYKGYRFRSRLEARWAVFFDALGIDWEYEKEGYDLGAAGWYLPDFWLPDNHGCFFEVKATEPIDAEREKCRQLALMHEMPCLIGYGRLGSAQVRFDVFHSMSNFSPTPNGVVLSNGKIEMDVQTHVYAMADNLDLDCMGIFSSFGIRGIDATRNFVDFPFFPASSLSFGHGDSWSTLKDLNAAFAAARAARFEHGEQG